MDASPSPLPEPFARWFASRGWSPRAHQLALAERSESGGDVLLIAPTGAGKTLAGFLSSLIDLSRRRQRANAIEPRLHTLYISPLKALAVDVARNLALPVEEMGLAISVETRTGDTSSAKRQRQRRRPPDILLTTPEQLALLLASPDAKIFFADLRHVVLDELHALALSKRGDLLALGLARLRRIAPTLSIIGLSATVRDPDDLRRWIAGADRPPAALVEAPAGASPDLRVLQTDRALPLAGHSGRHALAQIYEAIRQAKMTLIFVNTRAQAEFVFQDLWRINEDNLPIALHHGSLDAGQRRRVEEAMASGALKAVVCTSTLDLGVDWGDVDLVVNIGAPKGASRLMQRIGRANHRLDEPSRALLAPANRFEAIECAVAVDAVREGAQDTPSERSGALDVLAQHILGMACAAPFRAADLFAEVATVAVFADLSRETFDAVLNMVATGGYALASYDRFAKIKQTPQGLWRIANARVAQDYRLNCGVIVEAQMLRVRLMRARSARMQGASPSRRAGGLYWAGSENSGTGPAYTGPLSRGGRVLGQIEEFFLETLSPGDTFLFGGEVLALEGIVQDEALVSRASGVTPKVPSYAGGKFPLSTFLAARVRAMLAQPESWDRLPEEVADWLRLQQWRSSLPGDDSLLVETFPRGGRHYLVAYPFEGRLAHQTLGMLLTRRMERARLRPMGFVASDYALAIWGLADIGEKIRAGALSIDELFAQDMLGDDLEGWLQESALMKRSFRNCALISGLVPRRSPGRENTGRQVTMSTDLIYDVLRRHEPGHILLRAAREDAATGLLDLRRLGDMLARVKGHILHKNLDHVSPLAAPVMLEIGREPVYGEGRDQVLSEAAEALERETRIA
jgi:ATP-dependent Lhr-like helicase